ncbi:transposase IS3/IS911 [Burkholderia aenigmatica]|nr:transposase IS3/IS911 [Burkholderia aenigmatica]
MAGRLLRERRRDDPSMGAAVESIVPMIGRTTQTLLDWGWREEVDSGERDAIPHTEIKRAWQANVQVDGVPKVWKQMNRSGSQLKPGQPATGNSAMPLTCLH